MYGKLPPALPLLKGKKVHLANQENAVFQDKKLNDMHRKRRLFRHDLYQLRNCRYKTAALVQWYKLPFLSLF